MMTERAENTSLHLTRACWPVFEFLTNFLRQVQHGTAAAPDQVRYEALSALRDAEELAHDEPVSDMVAVTRNAVTIMNCGLTSLMP